MYPYVKPKNIYWKILKPCHLIFNKLINKTMKIKLNWIIFVSIATRVVARWGWTRQHGFIEEWW